MRRGRNDRPSGITALSIFFLAGAAISFTAGVSLLFPGELLEPMWRLNPRAREAFTSMGSWSIVLMAAVSLACGFSAVGLFRGARWGYRLAVALFIVHLLGDVTNVVLGIEPRGGRRRSDRRGDTRFPRYEAHQVILPNRAALTTFPSHDLMARHSGSAT